jgi:predicted aspartyl protease
MRINGEWLLCDDGVARPVLRGEILSADGAWKAAEFLVDTGADRTVLSAPIFARLGLTPVDTEEGISGVGGVADSVVIQTRIQFPRDGGGPVAFAGQFAAVTQIPALDISVLGRDITELFSVIVDRHRGDVCLIRDRHRYTILED